MRAASERAEADLRAWLEGLPALAASLHVESGARAVLLEDAAADAGLVTGAGEEVHPVLRADGHLALAAIQLIRASDTGDDALGEAALDHAEAAAEVALRLASSGPRLRLLTQAGAFLAIGAPLARHTRRRLVGRRLQELAEDIAEAFSEQAADEQRGVATLVAAQALAEGAAAVTPRARPAVRARALELARDAHRDLVRAGASARARVAASTVAALAGR